MYIWLEGQTYGSFTADAVQSYLAQWVYRGDDSAFMEGMANWLPLAQVLSALNQVPTPPVTTPIPPPKKRTTPENGPTSASTPWAKKKKPKAANKPSTTAEPRKPSGKLLTGGLAIKRAAVILVVAVLGLGVWMLVSDKNDYVDFDNLEERNGIICKKGESASFTGGVKSFYPDAECR